MTTPLARYQIAIQQGEFSHDPVQAQAVLHLQRLYDEWSKVHLKPEWHWYWPFRKKQLLPVRGLYLWGGVGIGKTWLMDTFYDCLATPQKMRMHFHRFMFQVHEELRALQGHADPLKIVAEHFARRAKILCLDEFFVADITDAMLLANLLQALFAEGVSLVATSNLPPQDLYRNGLQRERFLQAIRLIETHTEIMHLNIKQDYRLRTLEQAGVYFYPLNDETARHLAMSFAALTHGNSEPNKVIEIAGRSISTVNCGLDVVWFDFDVLCQVPRSQVDYLEIAQSFTTVILSNIPKISTEQDHFIAYLVNLVDVFYDARVKLLLSAAVAVHELYTDGRYIFEFQRTCSRLIEMQSQTYLSEAHCRR